ncbi:MAG: bifunctional diguanylate cyclase/phosphodiesterase [Spirochaetaceae bacterium]|jgi:diguanylate cyclase (GGDEF)-like protein|nr:bifunctional diguanylate cyclase/phosphodiesterase [Spirochaetaceae bacterium]
MTVPSSFFEIALPFFCVGAFISILLSIIVILRFFKNSLYYSLLFLTLICLLYGLGYLGTLIKQNIYAVDDPIFFSMLMDISMAALIYSLALFVERFLQERKNIYRLNRHITLVCAILSIGILVGKLLFQWITGSNVELNILYGPILLVLTSYCFLIVILFPLRNFSSTDRYIYPLAFFLVFYFVLAEFLKIYSRVDISPLPQLNYSRLLVGMVLFLSLIYFSIIKGFVRRARLEEAANVRAINSQKELIYSSSHDQLTGLKNRNSFYLHLSKSIHQGLMAENGDTMALLVIDVDNLKNINTSFGHSGGDHVLRVVAERLQHYLRVTDQVFRIGGDEFAAVLHRLTEPSLAGLAADKLIRAFSEPVELDTSIGERNIYVGISMGISCFPQDSEDPKGLINHGEMALYEAKKMRNSFRYYSKNMELVAEQRVTMTGIIRKALRQELFRLHFQPLNDIDGYVKGAEALIRLNYEEKEIAPSLLIPIAESSGLITRLGEWVIEEAIRSRREIENQIRDDFFVSINLSVKQLKDPNLLSFITHCLRRYQQKPSHFRFEITESLLMENFDSYIGVLREMKEMGLGLVLDDFGTGYSSLGYLKNLPIDTVKIDRTFLVNFPQDKQNGAIIESIFNLASGLNMDVVVEGVETHEQRSHLTSFDYSHLQGFYFSKPLSLKDFCSYLKQDNKKIR